MLQNKIGEEYLFCDIILCYDVILIHNIILISNFMLINKTILNNDTNFVYPVYFTYKHMLLYKCNKTLLIYKIEGIFIILIIKITSVKSTINVRLEY